MIATIIFFVLATAFVSVLGLIAFIRGDRSAAESCWIWASIFTFINAVVSIVYICIR